MKPNKIVLSLIFVFIFMFSVCVFTACSPNCQGLIIPNNQSSSEDSTSNSTNSGDTNNNSGNSNNQSGDSDGKTQEFSSVLDKVLNDELYLNLRNKFIKNNYIVKSNDMLPIPYKFLRNHGHNVDAYLDGILDAFASSYIYDNDKNHIYVSVKAENVSNSRYGNFYTNYVLKYPLTDQEYDEYIYLRKGYYLQAYLFIQELDNQKTPEMLSKVNIAKQTYEYMINSYGKSVLNPNKYNSIEIDITNLNENMISVSLRSKSNKNYYATTIGFANLETIPDYTRVYKYDNDVYYIVDAYQVNVLDLDKYPSSLQKITSFGDMHNGNYIYKNPYNYYDDWHPGEFYYG